LIKLSRISFRLLLKLAGLDKEKYQMEVAYSGLNSAARLDLFFRMMSMLLMRTGLILRKE
jgi:hypothetical protein